MARRPWAVAALVVALTAPVALPAHAAPTAVPSPVAGRGGPIPYTWPAPPAPLAYTPGQLTFTQFNVCKSRCDAPAPPWDVRRERVARVIAGAGGDVVGLNEATNWQVTHAKTQWLDIVNLMAGAGYAPTAATANECPYKTDCDHTAHLLYRTATVREVPAPNGAASSGQTTLGRIAPAVSRTTAIREVAWAFLAAADGSTPAFLAVAAHLPTQKDPATEADRVAVATSMAAWANNMVAEHGFPATTPVVLMADLNSYARRQPNGAQKVLTDAGWADSWDAPTRVNDRWSTINTTPKTGPWDAKPYFFYSRKNPVTRIDYIMARGATPVRYETNMWLNPDGTFIPEYQASDHQSIRATLRF